jgi:hypothetical protein
MALLVCARTERGNLRGVKGEREANGELDAVHGIVKTTTRSRVKSDPLHLSGWRGRADDENVISDSGWGAPSSTAPFGTHRSEDFRSFDRPRVEVGVTPLLFGLLLGLLLGGCGCDESRSQCGQQKLSSAQGNLHYRPLERTLRSTSGGTALHADRRFCARSKVGLGDFETIPTHEPAASAVGSLTISDSGDIRKSSRSNRERRPAI